MTNNIVRQLNDYESMLATSTCSVGMELLLLCPDGNDDNMNTTDDDDNDDDDDDGDIGIYAREAWYRTVAERKQLQVKLIKLPGDASTGPLGQQQQQQRYALSDLQFDDARKLFVVETLVEPEEALPDLVASLKAVGTTCMDERMGSFYVLCRVTETKKGEKEKRLQIIISMTNALSDGPGILQVAKSFLSHFDNVLQGVVSDMPKVMIQPPLDLQATILGNDYGKLTNEDKTAYESHGEFETAIGKKKQLYKMADGATVLPTEPQQNIPSDAKKLGSESNIVDIIPFSLSAEDTALLNQHCNLRKCSIQGALVAAALVARLKALGGEDKYPWPVYSAVLVPANMRPFGGADEDQCLCGSADIWFTTRLSGNSVREYWNVAKQATDRIRKGLQLDQQNEWYRRLFVTPSKMPKYSMMVSHLGVAPIDAQYGKIKVETLRYFGASPHADKPSKEQTTMIHSIIFRDEFHGHFNFSSPGVSKEFAIDLALDIEETLRQLAKSSLPQPSLSSSQC